MIIRLKSTDRTLAPYPGSKSNVIDRCVDFLPDDFTEFRDCFVGMGSLTFAIRKRYPGVPGWINDRDEKLITLWRVVQTQVEELMDFLWAIHREHGQGDERLYHKILEWYDHSTDPIEIAAAVLLKTRLVRGGPRKTWGYAGSRPANNDGLTPWRIMRLAGFSRLIQGLRITCSDYHEPLEAPGTNVLQLLDAPYEVVGRKLYEHGEIDLEEFARVVNGSTHKCLVMLNDSPNTRNLFRHHDPIIHGVKYSGGKVGSEIIVPTYITKLMEVYVRRHGTRLSVLESREVGNDNIPPVVQPSAPTMGENAPVEQAFETMVPAAANDDVEEYPMRPVGDNKKALFINEGNEKRNPEWYTPDWLLDLLYVANGERPFDVDPCSPIKGDAAPVWAKTHHTESDDGLSQPWQGRIFLNPPYRQLEPWLKKAADAVWCRHIPMAPTKESASRDEPLCETVIALIPARTHTRYWRQYVTNHARVLFINGKMAFRRVRDGRFYYPKSPFPEGLALVIWGNHKPFTDYLSAVSPDVIDVADRSHPTIPDLPFRHYWSQREFRLSVAAPVPRLIEQDNTRRILHRSGLKAANDNATAGSGRSRKRSKSKPSGSTPEQVLVGNGVATPSAETDVSLSAESTMPPAAQPIIEHVVSAAAKVYEGDCIEGMRRHVPDGSVDLIVADPPYAINGDRLDQHYHQGRKGIVPGYIEVSADDYPEFCHAWIAEVERVLRPGGSMYVVSGWSHLRHVENALANTGLELVNHLIWHYRWAPYAEQKFVSSHVHALYVVKPPLTRRVFNTNCRFSDSFQDRYDVWQIPRQYRTGQTRNQNQLPDALVEKMIAYSSKPGDVVLDPFLGGFTTATVALRMGRRVIGFEKNPNAVAAFLPALKQMVGEADNDNLPMVDAAEVA
jgi:DNA adenine methylase